MPNKDPKKRTEASKLRMQKMRKGVTDEGVTRIELIQRELNDPYLIKGIESASLIFKDRDARYERAYRYHLYGQDIPPALADAIVTSKSQLESITEHLKTHKVDKEIRYGINGPTFDVVGELLEVTQ